MYNKVNSIFCVILFCSIIFLFFQISVIDYMYLFYNYAPLNISWSTCQVEQCILYKLYTFYYLLYIVIDYHRLSSFHLIFYFNTLFKHYPFKKHWNSVYINWSLVKNRLTNKSQNFLLWFEIFFEKFINFLFI